MSACGARLALATGIAAAAMVCGAIPMGVSASVGTGVGANPISLSETATPGHSYALPSLYLVNTGTETSRYAVRVVRLEHGQQRDVPSSWVRVPSTALSLDPKASTNVPLTLDIPSGAAPGDYMTDVVAGTIAGGGGAPGASLGAQAATRLNFSVGSADTGVPWPPPGLAAMVVLAVVLLGALGLGVRRSGLRLHVERRR